MSMETAFCIINCKRITHFILFQLRHQIRLLLEHIGAEYTDKRFTQKSKDEWFSNKFSLGLAFPKVCIIF